MTDTNHKPTGRRVRIESINPNGAKRIGPAVGGRILIDDEDVSDHVLSADIHMDGKSTPTATLELVGIEVAVDALETTPAAATVDTTTPPSLQCVPCYLEVHAGQRQTTNPATMIVAGNSSCTEHVIIGPAPTLPGRTASGLILGEGV